MHLLKEFITSPEMLGLRRQPAKATFFHFDDKETAVKNKETASPYVLPLDGTWKFFYTTDPFNLDDTVISIPDLDRSGWDTAPVPGCWVMHGYDHPHYTNVVMPFRELPPESPPDTSSEYHNYPGHYEFTLHFSAIAEGADAAKKSRNILR